MNRKMKIEFDPEITILETRFYEFIRRRMGILIHPHQNYELLKTIQDGCDRFNVTPDEYFHQVILAQDQSPLLDHLISGITVGETYFFRDKNQMNLLQDNVLPDLIKRKQENHSMSLRIWSAGCSTGEEIYTIAMMLCEVLHDIQEWTIKL